MRIVLVNQFFWPDTAATSQLLTDLAAGLVQHGHEVHAVCAAGGYATNDAGEPPQSITIHRVPALKFSRKTWARLASYASFYLGATYKLLTMPRPDVVLTLTTPPLLSLIGNIVKLLRGSRHFIWEMDLYPDIAVDVGQFEANGVVDRSVGRIVDRSRKYATGIIALGNCMKARLMRRGTAAGKIAVVHNWADGSTILPPPERTEHRPLQILYSGNLGLAHDIDTISKAMPLLHDEVRLRFVGGGSRTEELRAKFARQNESSVEFASYTARSSLGASLGSCDIGLVTQSKASCGSVVPSKVYGLLAAGRPVLFIGPAWATPAQIIREHVCGWHVDVGQHEALADLLLHLAAHPDEVRRMSANARNALVEHFDRSIGVEQIVRFIGADLVDGRTGSRVHAAASTL